VARHHESRQLCIGLARSGSPEGPFIADVDPILSNNVIDPHLFVDEDQNAWLYWKEDNNDIWPGLLIDFLYTNPALITLLFNQKEDQITACFILTLWPWLQTLEPMERFQAQQIFIEAVTENYVDFCERLKDITSTLPLDTHVNVEAILKNMKTPMYAQQVSNDGSELVGKSTKIIENDLPWEAHLVEGMWVSKQNNHYYLFYAGNDFSTDQYGIGVAVASSPLGPFTKQRKPFLQSTEKWWAPGHPSVATDLDGKTVMFLHAYLPNKAGYKQFRALLKLNLNFRDKEVFIAQ